jgi:hypothetical protein
LLFRQKRSYQNVISLYFDDYKDFLAHTQGFFNILRAHFLRFLYIC